MIPSVDVICTKYEEKGGVGQGEWGSGKVG